MPWYVLHTKPKNEKKVASLLKDLGVEAYCPLRKEVRQWSDRRKMVEMPLLPSMILVNLEEKDRNIVFRVPGSLRYMSWLGGPAVVTQAEVEALQEVQSHGNNFRMQVEAIR